MSIAARPTSSSSSSSASPGDLVRRYFVQLTEGCGRRGCPNRQCFSCVDGPGQLDRTAAALRALELAQGGSPLHLCEEQPPFMHLEMVRGLISAARHTGEWRRLEKEVSGVFSNAAALNRSFLQSDAEQRQSAAAWHVPLDATSGLDTDAVVDMYRELLSLQSSQVVAALMNATDSLLRTLQVAQLSQPSFISDGASLRQFVILLLNPLLLEPQYHKPILLPLLSLAAALSPPCVDRIAFWWSLLPPAQLAQMLAVCQQFLTVRLCHTQRIDDAVIAATQVIGHLYTANELATEAGRRRADDGLDYRSFYNDAVNQEVNLKEDYRRWRSNRGEFSFCDHPFVLEPASKSRVLMYDATAQMTHEFEGAILRSLFVGATSPYLVVKVRRSHLIHDTLLQMGMRKDDLKKPLKVQFVGEDGIDEGGVQKEFFQLIFAQIFDVSYGMFVYDEDSRFLVQPLVARE